MPSFIGRTKLEPVSIIILSVVMGMASLQLIRESGQKIGTLVTDDSSLPDMGITTFVIAGSTVGKSGMLLSLFANHKACVPRFGLVELVLRQRGSGGDHSPRRWGKRETIPIATLSPPE